MSELQILYEDNHMIGVIKPPGLLSQADGSAPKDADLLGVVGEYLRVKYQKPGKAFVGLVHRLDRNVGGTMVLAKTSKGASRLSAELREGRFRKGYFALAEGHFNKPSGVLIHALYKDERRNLVTQDRKRGKESVLLYETVGSYGPHTLVFAVPVTGRTHQIRAQMAFSGHPLVDDVKYGGGRVTAGEISYPALWSSVVCVRHPVREVLLWLRSVPQPVLPWSKLGSDRIAALCSDYLKGFGENGFDRLYSLWR